MERAVFAGVTVSAVVALALLSGCADDSDTVANPCGGQPIVYVEQDDDETEYHCGSATGAVVPLVYVDMDTRSRAKAAHGTPVSFKPVAPPKGATPAPAKPGVNTVKTAAPAKPVTPAKPAAPAPKPAPKTGR